eukprot:scaffold7927_cov296-Pinguiococcus_pyrenoidosus.AAC.1
MIFAEEHNLAFIETSALDASGVDTAFTRVRCEPASLGCSSLLSVLAAVVLILCSSLSLSLPPLLCTSLSGPPGDPGPHGAQVHDGAERECRVRFQRDQSQRGRRGCQARLLLVDSLLSPAF